jgi:predicted nucleic acid-binding Zn ribbon protein
MVRPRNQKATPVGDLVKSLIQKLDAEKDIDEDDLLKVWERAAGKKASEHSRPVALFRKDLKIKVESSSWIQELTLNKRQILKKLQSHFGRDKIKDLKFKVYG